MVWNRLWWWLQIVCIANMQTLKSACNAIRSFYLYPCAMLHFTLCFSNGDGYASINDASDGASSAVFPVVQNGRPPSRNYVLKTEQRQEGRRQRWELCVLSVVSMCTIQLFVKRCKWNLHVQAKLTNCLLCKRIFCVNSSVHLMPSSSVHLFLVITENIS